MVIAGAPLVRALPLDALLWLVAGGAAYTLGTIFYARDRVRWFHPIWHLLVLAGSACHCVAVALVITGG